MYRKFSSDRIFNGYDFLPGRPVLLFDHTARLLDILPEADAGEDIVYLPGMLMPGMINAHCHIELSHLRDKISRHTGLVGFVEQVMALRQAPGEEKLEAMARAVSEMEKAGVVAVGDICNTPDSIPVKLSSAIRWHSFVELTGFVPATAERRMEEARQLLGQFRDCGLEATLSPHAPYSVSPQLLQLLNVATGNELISIHNQESPDETAFLRDGSGGLNGLYQQLGIDLSFYTAPGSSSFVHWLTKFNRGQRVISVHNTCITPDDIAYMKSARESGALKEMYFCLCARANEYIESATPPADLLYESDVRLVVGTDSLASNSSLNPWDEICLLRDLFPRIPEAVMLQWISSAAAEALGMDDELGSLRKGCRPGLVHVHDGKTERVI